MTARLFVCTTCDRYAAEPASPTRGEILLATVREAAVRCGIPHLVNEVACVMSCPRPCGAAVREGRGGGVWRFAMLAPADAPALVAFLARRSGSEPADLPEPLVRRLAAYIPPRRTATGTDD
jgi:predicted metal-binding protein